MMDFHHFLMVVCLLIFNISITQQSQVPTTPTPSSSLATTVITTDVTSSNETETVTTPISTPTTTTTTLKHVQVLFRHGDRAPLAPLYPNDPFNSRKFWPNGLDQLTTSGRARMFRLGEWIRARYGDYLGPEFSPREVNVRSSAIDRCLESAQLVTAGAYPPANGTIWQWTVNNHPLPLSQIWQPIPIASFLPPNDDSLLRTKRPCPVVEQADEEFFNFSTIATKLLDDNRELLQELSQITQYPIDTVRKADRFHENLAIEHEAGYYWYTMPGVTPNWTLQREREVLQQLAPFTNVRWNNEWNLTETTKRIRAGELLSVIGENFVTKKSLLDLQNRDLNKLHLFSSHDTKVAAVLAALDVWHDNIIVPYGAALIFELYHVKSNVDADGNNIVNTVHNHFNMSNVWSSTATSTVTVGNNSSFYVQIRYFNETMKLLQDVNTNTTSVDLHQLDGHLLRLPACDYAEQCPLDRFLSIVERFRVMDWNEECGIVTVYQSDSYLTLVNILLLIANLTILFIMLIVLMYYWGQVNKRPGYQLLK